MHFSTWNRWQGRTTKISRIQIQTEASQLLITNQTKVLTTQRLKIWILNPRPHEAQLEDQKPKKSSRRSSRRRKNCKTNKWQEKQQTKEKAKKSSNSKLPLKQTLPNTLNASSPP
jgi:hypothetical protein